MNYMLSDIGQLIKETIPDANYSIKEDDVDKRNYRVNFDKITKALNFKPSIGIKEGILEMKEKIMSNNQLRDYKESNFSNLLTVKNQFK